MKNLLFIFLLFGLKAASQTAFPLYLPGSSNTDSIKQVVNVNGSPRQVYNIDLVKFQAAKAAHDTATILRLLIPTNNNQLTNGAGFITSSALTPYLTSANAASTYQPIGSYLTGSNTISINGSSQTLGSNPSFTVSAGSGSSLAAPVWNRRGVVMSGTTTADQDNAYEPSVIIDSTTTPVIFTTATKVFRMWFTTGWTVMNINYAESLDGVTWTRYSANPIIANHRCSFVLRNGSTFIMYTATTNGAQIDRYTSTDGATWTLANAAVIVKNTATWNAAGVFNTSVSIGSDGVWRLLLDGGNGAGTNYSQGLYTSPDGITWTAYAGNPVLTGLNQGSTFHTKIGSTYYVWCGISNSSTANLPSDIVRYSSPDMITWTRNTIYSLKRRTTDEGAFKAVGQATDAFITPVDTSLYLYYSASSDGSAQTGKLQIKLAIAPMSFSSIVQTQEGDGALLPIPRSDWSLAGNNVDQNAVIGTIDSVSLRFMSAGVQKMRLDSIAGATLNLQAKGSTSFINLAAANSGQPYLQFNYPSIVDARLYPRSSVNISSYAIGSGLGVYNAGSTNTAGFLASQIGANGGTIAVSNTGADVRLHFDAPAGFSSQISFREVGVANRGIIGFANASGNFQIRTGANTITTGNLGLIVDANGSVAVGGLTTATSTLTTGGSFATAYTAKTAAYTATISDHTIDCNGTFTITLPTAVGITGRIYVIKNSGAGTITMAGTSAQTFDGAASPTIAAGAVSQYQSNGANWIKIN